MEDSIITTGQRDESSPVKGRKSDGRMIVSSTMDEEDLVVRGPMSQGS